MTTRPLIPCTGRQTEALARLKIEYPPPFVIGWRCTDTGVVEGSIFRSVEADEQGCACGEFSMYSDGDVKWWRTA